MRYRHLAHGIAPAIALAAFAIGCSSTVGNPTPSYGTATSSPVQTASVVFTITPGTAPAAATRARRPAYLSPATQSVSIVPVVVGHPDQKVTVVNVVAGDSGCTGSGASLSCTGTVVAPVGETSFTVTTYLAANGAGAVLSVGTITIDVKPTGASTTISNATSLTLGGTPASFTLSVTPPSITIGTSSTLTADVTAYDASGSIIIGPAELSTGIELETIAPAQVVDPVLHATTSAMAPFAACTYPIVTGITNCYPVAFVTGAEAQVTLAYDGEGVTGSSITLVGESPQLASKAVTIAFASPPPAGACSAGPVVVCPGSITFANGDSPTVALTVSEPGVSTFNVIDTDCVQGQTASIDQQATVTGSSFTVYPGTVPGNCIANVSDAAGNSTDLSITLLAGKPSPTPSPTAAPTASPTPVPIGPITISPSNVVEFTSSTAAPQTITASEANFNTFTIDQTACAGVVTVSPSSGATFAVAPVASLTQGGSCTFDVVDPTGQISPVKALVDGVSFTINSKR
jgi:hypothetical protein